MSMEHSDEVLAYEEHEGDDGRTSLALAAGLGAAVVAGGLWAAIVYLTNMEIGYAAWGVGLLVGVAMTRLTRARTQQLAVAAALFACIGLVAGKAFIFAGSGGKLAEALESDPDALKSGMAWQLYEDRELDESTLRIIDAAQASGDTLSDAVWNRMREQSGRRLDAMSDAERHEAAAVVAKSVLANVGIVGGIRSQLSGFDLLWLFLAVGTAYRMMAPAKRETVPEPEGVSV